MGIEATNLSNLLRDARDPGGDEGTSITYDEYAAFWQVAKKGGIDDGELKLLKGIETYEMGGDWASSATNLHRFVQKTAPLLRPASEQGVRVGTSQQTPRPSASPKKPSATLSIPAPGPYQGSLAAREDAQGTRSSRTQNLYEDLWDGGEWGYGRDASVAELRGNNVEFLQYTHPYPHEGRAHLYAREAVLKKAPESGVLDLTLFATPSSHVGPDSAAKDANYEKFAKNNRYRLRIEFPDGTIQNFSSTPQRALRNRPTGEAEYVTAFDLKIPLMKGDTKISAWPEGSAGVAGYIERRQTVLSFYGAPAATEE